MPEKTLSNFESNNVIKNDVSNDVKNDVSIEDEDDFVDPWNVESKSDKGIDYDKLISKLTLTDNFMSMPKGMEISKQI